MTSRSFWTTSSLLWLTAFSGLLLASVALRADRDGVIGLTLCGGLLCLVAIVTEPRDSARPSKRSWMVLAILAAAGGFELLALILLGDVRKSLGLWYAVVLFQSITGAVLAWRREPRDAALLCVMAYHTIVNFPTAILIILILIRWTAAPDAALPPLSVSLSSMMVSVVVVILMPLFILLALTMLLLEATQPAGERQLGWSVHLVSLLTTAIILARWSARGL